MRVVICELDAHTVPSGLVGYAAGLDPDVRMVPADRLAFPLPIRSEERARHRPSVRPPAPIR